MWRCVDLALTDVSEKRIASIFRVEKSASYWVNARSVALDFSPPPTYPLSRIDLPLLPADLTFTTDPTPILSVDFPCGLLCLSPCYIAGCFRLVAQLAASCSRWFPARGFFYPEDGGDTFLRNVG
jgi:hypothetical protein